MGSKDTKKAGREQDALEPKKLNTKVYEEELFKLQIELCKLQEWVKQSGTRAIVLFEGRDAAGKGGVLKRITERVSPRVFRLTALPAPSSREKTQFYIQRYMAHFPAAGEIVLFDRSWYNRPGVERVLGFCTLEQVEYFFQAVTLFENMVVESGIRLIKYWFEVSFEEQQRRFRGRMTDPTKHWKLSPTDLESQRTKAEPTRRTGTSPSAASSRNAQASFWWRPRRTGPSYPLRESGRRVMRPRTAEITMNASVRPSGKPVPGGG